MEFKEYKKLDFNIAFENMNYPKEMWPILNEYFSRYKYEFELSDDEIIKN